LPWLHSRRQLRLDDHRLAASIIRIAECSTLPNPIGAYLPTMASSDR
jgi:hypothetical protein